VDFSMITVDTKYPSSITFTVSDTVSNVLGSGLTTISTLDDLNMVLDV
jgi:hypothetical protein